MKTKFLAVLLAAAMALNVTAASVSAAPTSEDSSVFAGSTVFAGNSQLAGIEINGAPLLNPLFTPEHTDYTATAYRSTTQLQVKPTTLQPGATVKVNDTVVTNSAIAVPIVLGENKFTVEVTSKDTKQATLYNFTVTKVNTDYRGRVVLQNGTDFTVTASSNNDTVGNIFDNNRATTWTATASSQQEIEITFNSPRLLSKINYGVHVDDKSSIMKDFQILTAGEDKVYTPVVTSTFDVWFEENIEGAEKNIARDLAFPQTNAKYLKLVIKNTMGNQPTILRELLVFADPNPDAEIPPAVTPTEYKPHIPSNPNLSRGSELTIAKGLELSSWFPHDGSGRDIMNSKEFEMSNLSGAVFYDAPMMNKDFFKYNPDSFWGMSRAPFGQASPPTFNPSTHTDILTSDIQKEHADRLGSVCFGDEQGYSYGLVTNLGKWFDLSKKLYPQAMVFGNQWAGQFNETQLNDLMRRAKPDLLTFDNYYWSTGGKDLNMANFLLSGAAYQRKTALLGYDGTGSQPIVFGQYLGCYKIGSAQQASGWYEPTESQEKGVLNVSLAAGMKWFDLFRTEFDTLGFVMFDKDGAPTHQFYEWAEAFAQTKNYSDHLSRLNSDYVVTKPGQHLVNGSAVNNTACNNWTISSFADGAAKNAEYHIADVQASNLGTQNDGLSGDVVLGYFKPLPGLDTREFFTATAPKYFMVVNSLITGNGKRPNLQHGASYDTLQDITITVDNPANIPLKKVNKDTGKTESVELTPVAGQNGKYTMTIRIGGGEAELFYWEENSTANASTYEKNNLPEFAFDGRDGTTWTPLSSDVTPWISKSFENVQSISKLTIKESGANISEFKLQYMDPNDNQWKDIPNATGTTIGAQTTVSFAPIDAKGIKLVLTKFTQTPTIKDIFVPANMTGATIKNGTLSIQFDRIPATAPTLSDFVIDYKINGQPLAVTGQRAAFNNSTKSLDVTFDLLQTADKDDKIIEATITYGGDTKSASFTLWAVKDQIHWDFEEGSGKTITDSVGHVTATFNDSIKWVDGRVPGTKAAYFNGSDTYAIINGQKDFVGPWTISTWVNREDVGDYSLTATVLATSPTSAVNGNVFDVRLQGWQNEGKLGITKIAVADYSFDVKSDLNRWTNITFVYDGTNVLAYLDGKLADTKNFGRINLPLGSIGRYINAPSCFKGAMDDLNVFKRALSAKEVADLAEVVKTHTVTFNIDGTTTTATAKVGEAVETPAVPEKTGYTFDGWYTELTGGTKVTDFTEYNGTVYARYAEIVVEGVDRRDLVALVAYAKAQKNSPDYIYVVPVVKTALDDRIAVCEAVISNPASTQTAIDTSYKLLLNIVHMLSYVGNDSSLQTAYDDCSTLDRDLYTPNSLVGLDEALVKAKAVLDDENALQAEIDSALEALNTAKAGLALRADKTSLKATIDRTDVDLTLFYDGEAKDTFKQARARAIEVYNDGNATAEQVKNAQIALRDAEMKLRLIPNKTALEDLIKELEKVNLTDFTQESASNLVSAISVARAVLANPFATQAEINAAANQATAAYNSLVKADSNIPTQTPDSDNDTAVVKPVEDKTTTTETKAEVPSTSDSTPIELAFALALMGCAVLAIGKKARRN